MLREIAQFLQILWAVITAAGLFLLVLLAVRRNYRAFPAFFFYILVNIAVTILTFMIYRWRGFSSPSSMRIGWAMQAAVILARALAVVEICKHFLARYSGIWVLAKRILMACAVLVLLYSVTAAKQRWELALLAGDRGVELSIAAVVVGLLLFVRYYDVQANRADRLLAVGFCLYSCFCALNNTVLERYLDQYVSLWNLLGMLAFLASLLLWTWALRKPQSEVAAEEALLPAGVYQAITPQINLRLQLVNEQLSQFWKPSGSRR